MPVIPLADAARAAFAVREVDEAQARTLGFGQRLPSAGPRTHRTGRRDRPGRHPRRDARRVASHRAQPRRVRPGEFVEWGPCIAGPTRPGRLRPSGPASSPSATSTASTAGTGRCSTPSSRPATGSGCRRSRSPSSRTRSPCCGPTRRPSSSRPAAMRDELIADTGIDGLLVLDFTTEFAQQTPGGLRPRRLRARPRRPLRRRRHGHPLRLPQLRRRLDAAPTSASTSASRWSRSTTSATGSASPRRVVRRHLRAGEVAEAARILGRPHRVVGTVVHGNHRGPRPRLPDREPRRRLRWASSRSRASTPGGSPALDLGEGERDRTMPAAISVGTNPTFETRTGARVEAYVLDRDDLDLYDETRHGRVHRPHPPDAAVRQRRAS